MQMSTSSYHELANGGTVNNGGHTIWSDGYLWRYSQDNSATFCSFNNLAGGLFEMTGNNSATVAASKAWSFTKGGHGEEIGWHWVITDHTHGLSQYGRG